MGKASRRKRKVGAKQRPARPQAAQLAERANRAAALVIGKLDDNLGLLSANTARLHMDVTTWPNYRKHALDAGFSWPHWSWLPYTTILTMIGGDIGDTLSPHATLGDLESVVTPAVAVLNWLPGRIAVRYDPDIVDTFAATPIDDKIPTHALYKLPSWGLFLDCPWLAPDAGVFACIDPGRIEGPDGEVAVDSNDELLMTFVLPASAPPIVHLSLWFPEGTIAAALAAQDRQPLIPGVLHQAVHADRPTLEGYFGRPVPEIISIVMSMLLYLCVEDPDITRRPFALQEPAVTYHRDHTKITVIEAGWRMGSSLRSARARYAQAGVDATGRHVAPHLRRAHWHSFWTGPLNAQRELILRYLPPIQVATPDDELPQLTIVRDAD